MSSKYKLKDDAIPHFITFSVVGWIDVFSRECYKENIVESLKYCQENKGMILHARVVMRSDSGKIESIVRDFKKYTSKQIIKAIQTNNRK